MTGGKYANCTENVLVEDVRVKYGVGMTVGAVPPRAEGNCVRNVTFRNVEFFRPFKAIYIKTNPGENPQHLLSLSDCVSVAGLGLCAVCSVYSG